MLQQQSFDVPHPITYVSLPEIHAVTFVYSTMVESPIEKEMNIQLSFKYKSR